MSCSMTSLARLICVRTETRLGACYPSKQPEPRLHPPRYEAATLPPAVLADLVCWHVASLVSGVSCSTRVFPMGSFKSFRFPRAFLWACLVANVSRCRACLAAGQIWAWCTMCSVCLVCFVPFPCWRCPFKEMCVNMCLVRLSNSQSIELFHWDRHLQY